VNCRRNSSTDTWAGRGEARQLVRIVEVVAPQPIM